MHYKKGDAFWDEIRKNVFVLWEEYKEGNNNLKFIWINKEHVQHHNGTFMDKSDQYIGNSDQYIGNIENNPGLYRLLKLVLK